MADYLDVIAAVSGPAGLILGAIAGWFVAERRGFIKDYEKPTE